MTTTTPPANDNNNDIHTDAPSVYIFADGEKVRASSHLELINHMRSGSFDESPSVEDYMFRFSERTLLSLQLVVRFDKPENFIADLKKYGLIQAVVKAN